MIGKRSIKRVLLPIDALLVLLLLISLPSTITLTHAQTTQTPGLTLTVTNSSEELNGDLSSPAALLANPGPDGISLPEALQAVQADTGTHETINFDPSLSGTVIKLTQPLPPINRGSLTLDGDINDDGVPDITLDSLGEVHEGLQIQAASDVVIEGLQLRNFTSNGIEITTNTQNDISVVENITIRNNILTNIGWSAILIGNFRDHAVIRNVELSGNTLKSYRFGITIHTGFAADANYNEISNISINSNRLTASAPVIGIYISPTGLSDLSHNTIRDIQIKGNHISGHTSVSILIDDGAENCRDNLTSDITIAENQVSGSLVTIEILSESGANSSGNRLTNVTITDNRFTGGGIQFSGATGDNAYNNSTTDILIDRNIISDCAANGISFYAGTGGAHDNLLENVIVRNTLVNGCLDAGILLHGDDGKSRNNQIKNVTISNVTLVNNGIENLWAGGLNINTLDARNTIDGVSVVNTILWQNGGNDAILGSESPTTVTYSRLNDARFTGHDGNFNTEPGFVDPASGDYHLQPASPCVDSGVPSAEDAGAMDLDQAARVQDGNGDGHAVVDLGAYENKTSPVPIIQKTEEHSTAYKSPLGLVCLTSGLLLVLFLVLRKRRS